MDRYTCYVDFTRSPSFDENRPTSDRKYFDGYQTALAWIVQQTEDENWIYSYISITTTHIIISK